ncbi:hypothetical protein ACB098_07G066200 [Castanea mollissima]
MPIVVHHPRVMTKEDSTSALWDFGDLLDFTVSWSFLYVPRSRSTSLAVADYRPESQFFVGGHGSSRPEFREDPETGSEADVYQLLGGSNPLCVSGDGREARDGREPSWEEAAHSILTGMWLMRYWGNRARGKEKERGRCV